MYKCEDQGKILLLLFIVIIIIISTLSCYFIVGFVLAMNLYYMFTIFGESDLGKVDIAMKMIGPKTLSDLILMRDRRAKSWLCLTLKILKC